MVTWTNETWSSVSGSGNIGPATVNTTITNNLNYATTYIAFVIDGDLFQFDNWYIDNVSLKSGNTPAVTTTPVSAITSTTAISGGNIIADGGTPVTARGVCWSTTANPTVADSKTSDGTGTGAFISNITGLTAGTTYHVRAYAINSAETGYGDDLTFTTSILMPPGNLSASIQDAVSGIVGLLWNDSGAGIYEDFEDGIANNFIFSNSSFNVSNGYLKLMKSGDDTWSSAYYDKDFDNFVLEYKFQRDQGDHGYSIGTFIRSNGFMDTGNESGYLINVNSSGDYGVWRKDNGSSTNIIPWTGSSAINSGYGISNIVTINANGSNISIYVNSIYVDEFNDATYTTGKVNLGAYTASGIYNEISWDYINLIPEAGLPSIFNNLPKSANIISGGSDITKSPAIKIENKANEVKGILFKKSNSAAFQYYKLYRNGSVLDTTSLTSYTDTLPDFGNFEYKVSALYDEGESQLSDPASIDWYGNPEISVNPLSFDETLLSGDSIKKTLTISNNGSGLLIFEIDNSSDIVNKSSVSTLETKVVAVGRPLKDLNELKVSFPKQMAVNSTDLIDKGTPFRKNNPMNEPIQKIGGEEVFGSTEYEYFAGPRTRGNLFTCTTSTTLIEHRLYIDPNGFH